MKCLVVFYTRSEAERFAKSLTHEDADIEIIQTYESDDLGRETVCFVVYYNPPRKEV